MLLQGDLKPVKKEIIRKEAPSAQKIMSGVVRGPKVVKIKPVHESEH